MITRFLALAAVLAISLAAPDARGEVCSAADFGCPASGTCTISGLHQVGDFCFLDFGDRDVVLKGTLEPTIIGGGYEIRARSLTLQGGRVRSTGTAFDGGGFIDILVSEELVLTGSGARIDTSGNGGGGDIFVIAGSISILSGAIDAGGGGGFDGYDAGEIFLLAESGPLIVDGASPSVISQTPGWEYTGGAVYLEGTTVEIRKTINAAGGSPNGVEVVANAGDLRVTGLINANAKGSDEGSGNDGGPVVLTASGDLIVSANVQADGTFSDGTGGDIELTAGGSIDLSGDLLARHGGAFGTGGSIALRANDAIQIAQSSRLDAKGGDGGSGAVELHAGGSIQIDGLIAARGTNGGAGGPVLVRGCAISVSGTGTLDAGAVGGGDGGVISFEGAGLDLLVSSQVLSVPCSTSDCIDIVLRSGAPQIDPGAAIDPAPATATNATLRPCCGNGRLDDGLGGNVDGGESCDDGNSFLCDGCTPQCDLEPVPACPPDANDCTRDCHPLLGCTYQGLNGVACADDGSACTEDVCTAGVCVHSPVTCDDGVTCTADTCDPAQGCVHAPDDARCDDGSSCTTEFCDGAAGCVITREPEGSACEDGDLCTVDERCQWGVCIPNGTAFCDDGDPCTLDVCNTTFGCMPQEDPASCDCSLDGTPLPAGTPCADGSGCTFGDTCDGAGACTPGAPCPDDGDPCTIDGCLFDGCAHLDAGCQGTGCTDGEPCSDGSSCTTGICNAGECISTPIACDDADPENGSEACFEVFGCRQTTFAARAPLTPWLCFKSRKSRNALPGFSRIEGVDVEDPFGSLKMDLRSIGSLCLPAAVEGEPSEALERPEMAEAGYRARGAKGEPPLPRESGLVTVTDLGALTLDTVKRKNLLDPAAFDEASPAPQLALPRPDSFSCAKIRETRGAPRFEKLFGVQVETHLGPLELDVRRPDLLCRAANVEGSTPSAPERGDGLVCFRVAQTKGTPRFQRIDATHVTAELSSSRMDVVKPFHLCVPAEVLPTP